MCKKHNIGVLLASHFSPSQKRVTEFMKSREGAVVYIVVILLNLHTIFQLSSLLGSASVSFFQELNAGVVVHLFYTGACVRSLLFYWTALKHPSGTVEYINELDKVVERSEG